MNEKCFTRSVIPQNKLNQDYGYPKRLQIFKHSHINLNWTPILLLHNSYQALVQIQNQKISQKATTQEPLLKCFQPQLQQNEYQDNPNGAEFGDYPSFLPF